MERQINSKCKIISNNTSLIQPTQTIVESKYKKSKCTECNRRRKPLDESHQICHVCYKIKLKNVKQSGNKIIDDFIRYTQINLIKDTGKLEFVPYDQFKNIKFIAEGGFSKVYKANWTNGPVINWNGKNDKRTSNYTVVLKKLINSKNITSKELNELKMFYDLSSKLKRTWDYRSYICEYFGITQDPNSQDIMIIMPYYNSGDLSNYITNCFYNVSWYVKMEKLRKIIRGLYNMHSVNIIHRDFHSGNIFFDEKSEHDYFVGDITIGDLGISKSATESESNENYGIIPYMAPEIFQGQKYTKASDVYSFGMIMWELMTGRRPFWDRSHDTELILDIYDGLRPPIVTNAPKGYIELMKECWHSDPNKRPNATYICEVINKILWDEENKNSTEIIDSSDSGPVTKNNPGAIYKSRLLSAMISSAMSLRCSRSQSINLEIIKRRIEDDLINEGQSLKRKKLNDNEDYLTIELEFDINMNLNNNSK